MVGLRQGGWQAAYISRTSSLPASFSFFFWPSAAASWFFFRRASRWPIILLTWGMGDQMASDFDKD